jgi:hypothetical protein
MPTSSAPTSQPPRCHSAFTLTPRPRPRDQFASSAGTTRTQAKLHNAQLSNEVIKQRNAKSPVAEWSNNRDLVAFELHQSHSAMGSIPARSLWMTWKHTQLPWLQIGLCRRVDLG